LNKVTFLVLMMVVVRPSDEEELRLCFTASDSSLVSLK